MSSTAIIVDSNLKFCIYHMKVGTSSSKLADDDFVKECPSDLQAKKCVYEFFSSTCTDCCRENGYSVEVCPQE